MLDQHILPRNKPKAALLRNTQNTPKALENPQKLLSPQH